MKVKTFYGSSKNLDELNSSVQEWIDEQIENDYKFHSRDVYHRDIEETWDNEVEEESAIAVMITVWMIENDEF